ncbi:hypothetical protein LCGC14_2257800 [marine sediment metagenome]|uniref:Uncharacterized protein n=1 Tax=marine sediment metagenome TaxID=412755 RepID=A0A0F9DN15_9ZZZZ
MLNLYTITESNKPKEPTVFELANKRAEQEVTGFEEAVRVVVQSRRYDGGQIDMFPDELIEISSLFLPKVRG